METPTEETILLERSERKTRGKRMTKLLDEEFEEDEQFWNQEALKEEENDTNYEEEAETFDEFDSDFDDDEPEPDDEEEIVADERGQTKKRLIFPGKPVKKKSKKKVLSDLEEIPKEEESPVIHQPSLSDHQESHDDLETERMVRKSTRTLVVVRQAERDAIRAALQASIKPIKRKKEGEEKRMTQEEMLLEAAQTEIMNLRNLERVLAREEEVKKRSVIHKEVYSGPQIRYFSKNGNSYLEFINGLSFESEICTTPMPYPKKEVCAITGLPAKYRDPKTGLPYASIEAFKILRARLSEEENRMKMKRMEMGELFDLISGCGFINKRKRSKIMHTTGTTSLRSQARFRKIPVLVRASLD